MAFDLWLSAGQPDHYILGCPAYVLVVSGKRTTDILSYFERCLYLFIFTYGRTLPQLKMTCFVRYVKITNTLLKSNISTVSKN